MEAANPEPKAERLHLEVPAAHSAGRMAREVVGQFGRREGLKGEELSTLEFVASELLSNAVDHGGGGAAMDEEDLDSDVRISIHLTIGPRDWELCVADQGGGTPEAVSHYLLRDGLPDLEDERGRGFFLLREMLKDLTVRTSPDGKGLEFVATRSHRSNG